MEKRPKSFYPNLPYIISETIFLFLLALLTVILFGVFVCAPVSCVVANINQMGEKLDVSEPFTVRAVDYTSSRYAGVGMVITKEETGETFWVEQHGTIAPIVGKRYVLATITTTPFEGLAQKRYKFHERQVDLAD